MSSSPGGGSVGSGSITEQRVRVPYRDIVISELTGNIVSDSVIVNIDNSSSSDQSQSENDNNYEEEVECEQEEEAECEAEEEEEDDEFASESGKLVEDQGSPSSVDEFDDDFDDDDDDDDDEKEEMNHDDWEVRMLAAEMHKRESVSTDFPSDLDESDGLLRRRRKRSETDTDGSGAELEVLRRPRASSLDQHNLRRGMSVNLGSSSSSSGSKRRGSVFKAMSFDRDKDRL